MAKNGSKEILTKKDYLKVTIPFMLSTATQPLLGAANTAMMGRMPSADYIAAVALSVIFFNNIYWLFGFLRVATTAFSSQAAGSRKLVDMSVACLRPFCLAVMLSVLFVLLYPFIFDWYADFMQPTANVLNLMKEYSDIALIAAPFVLLNYVLLGWLMGQMMIKKVMFMQISMNLLNIALSFITVFVLGMDVDGVAWSMTIAQGYGLLVGIWSVIKSRRFYIHAKFIPAIKDFSAFGKLLKVQLDLMIRTACLLFINNMFTEAGTSLGTENLAANAVLLELIFIISFFIDGMANGVSVFGGKAWGAQNIRLMDNTIKTALQCLWQFSLLTAVVFFLGGNFFLHFMTNQPTILATAANYTIYLAIHPITAGVGLLLYGIYTATGYTKYVRNMMLIAAALFFVTQHVLLPVWGNHGLWITYIVTYFFESVAYYNGINLLKQRMAGEVILSSTLNKEIQTR